MHLRERMYAMRTYFSLLGRVWFSTMACAAIFLVVTASLIRNKVSEDPVISFTGPGIVLLYNDVLDNYENAVSNVNIKQIAF